MCKIFDTNNNKTVIAMKVEERGEVRKEWIEST